ncbi:SRPBCC family protein [Crossiella sp. CA-258035]|uniref:SRPBCC family protein n=1 Tax=Crossiella sp. CA-258035 TaxID=2981138 RepID=UPI0024BBFDDA|nr:SRPBCC family protein [Crossiella sp. CA-258035]WHT16467.1 SRPBCC family protein [Crossiella sp. CA-258035]
MAETTTETRIEINRVLPGTRARIYQAWTDVELFVQWYGTDPERTTLDARPGGKWRGVLVYEGQEMTFSGEFVELVPDSRVVLTLTDQADGSGPHALITVALTEVEGGTNVQFTQVGPLPEEYLEATTAGWQGYLDELAKVTG